MRPIASTMTEVDRMQGEEVKFSISTANSAWIMRSMADLYSNRELACIREYSTNAYDSNKEKAMRDGHETAPIMVTLPNAMNPFFEVQDLGVGMSEAELKEVYTQFGESTKRDSDDFNGMLGFGSKSAIAYTNTFTVTSIKNGIQTVAVITRREDAMGGYLVTMKIVLSDMPTSGPSGVSIQIPVHNWREFEQKANDFYRFWMPGTVVVNGREPEWAVGDKIDEGLFYNPGNQQNTSYVVMGNVPYRITNSDALFPAGMNKISFVAYVPLGTVEFTPSREDLKYSEHTKSNLRKIITDFVKRSVATASNEILLAKTHHEAFNAWVKWRKVLGASQVADLTFKGEKLVDTFAINAMRYELGSYRGGAWTIAKYAVGEMPTTIIVTDFDINLAAAHKRKVKDWIRHTGVTASIALFTSEKTVTNPWIDPSRVVSWERVKSETPKPPRAPRQPKNIGWGRKAGSFDLITSSGKKSEQDVPNVKELFYISVSDYNRKKTLEKILASFKMDDEVVLVPANRKDKFLRFYPEAKDIMPVLKSKVVLNWKTLISKEGEVFLSTSPTDVRVLGSMKANSVEDPAIKSIIPIFKKTEEDYLKEYDSHLRLASVLDIEDKFIRHPWVNRYQRKSAPLTSLYPLASNFNYYSDSNTINRHVYIYMNALFRARKEGSNV